MNIEKRVRFGLLLDFYGNMLTEKQLSISKKYFEEDIALVEIAEEFGISRQAVLDTIKKSEQQLESFERKLQLVNRHNCLQEKLSEVISVCYLFPAQNRIQNSRHQAENQYC